jgi:hypothetical protein
MARPARRIRRIAANLALLGAAGIVALLLAELALRLVPIPGIVYNSFRYDPVTGGTLYPHTTMIYRGARGEEVRRKVNGWGYLDEDHERRASDGTVRLGFFGDSYTEARQVPLDSTFFRLIEDGLNETPAALRALDAQRAETIAFGISGRSTLQSYLDSRIWKDRADLDYVVYVFCENDATDQIPQTKHSSEIPYPILTGDSLVVDFSFRDRVQYKSRQPHRTWQFLKAHSLVLSTLETRLKMLLRHGIKLSVTRDDMEMEAVPGGGDDDAFRYYDESDALFVRTRDTLLAVLDAWRRDVVDSGRRFIILYVPSQRQMRLPLEEQKAWRPLLIDYCAANNIDFVDPSSRFVAAADRGVEVFYDHFTPAGHRLAAETFVDYFARRDSIPE